MKITKKTNLHYSYFDDTRISLNNKICFYYESSSSLDKYQILEEGTDKVIVCSETKEELLNYLISQNAEIINSMNILR